MKKTVRELRALHAAKIEAADAISTKCEAENRDMTDEELTSFKALTTEAKALKVKIASAEETAKLQAETRAERVALRQASGEEEVENEDDLVIPGAGLPRSDVPAGRQVARVSNVRERFRSDLTNRGFRHPREFFMAVMNQGMGKGLDPRLRPLATNKNGELLSTAGSDEGGEYADSYGGFLIPVGFSPNLLMVDPEGDPTAALTMKMPMSAPSVKIPARTDKDHTSSVSGGLQWKRRIETGDTSAGSTRQQFEQLQFTANSLFGFTFQTNELIQDSPISIVGLISQGFTQELSARLLYEKLYGLGGGEYLGILNAPAKVAVAKETNQAAATINYQNVLKMRARCWGYSKAVWLANHDTFPQLAQLVMNVGTGGLPVYMFNAQGDRPDTLLGRPIYYSEFPQTVGTEGDLILFNAGEYIEAQLGGGMDFQESIHVRFAQNEKAFRATTRNDGQLWWRTALTPKKGANTLSPVVTLAVRA